MIPEKSASPSGAKPSALLSSDEQRKAALLFSQTCAALDDYMRIAIEAQKAGLSRCCIMVSCGVPSTGQNRLLSLLADTGFCAAYCRSADDLVFGGEISCEHVPSSFSASLFVDPFRLIVSVYARPAYLHADPSLVGGIGFAVMFGIMFADIGHALVILCAAIIVRAAAKSLFLRRAGGLMIYCGLSALVFGFLFGSFFGREDIIHPLWFSPMHNTGKFLALGIAVGIVIISAGIILNIVQKIWQRSLRAAIFSQWGVLSLIFYWLCAAAVFYSFRYGSVPLPTPLLILCIALPVIIMTAGDAISAVLTREGDAAEIAFMPVDIVLGLLSNTVSFVRVAAFGLTHSALMAAVYLVAKMTSDNIISQGNIAVEGNIFVIALEGMIVTIQCFRLQFYEFYSKFFSVQ
ncbi:MAG: V-type ATPase 116kDa subunit family protein, partial [Spirochaetota bacterium]